MVLSGKLMALMNRSEQVVTESRYQGIDSQETSENGAHIFRFKFLHTVGELHKKHRVIITTPSYIVIN